ncbi:Uncharacterised protein [Legionella sainthelensi]|nr:Uncharacterised protein [Legionella sainthelensi]
MSVRSNLVYKFFHPDFLPLTKFALEYVHNTSCLDEYVDYYNNPSIRLDLFAILRLTGQFYFGIVLDKTLVKPFYGNARKYHLFEVSLLLSLYGRGY